ncbi:hypothetical protein RND71_035865 [Anisodus tanguticus]|uniref:Uncharacterized protein n=1 Tax=Anisodus tanguticus TaxID=243964 RepID=A0AAE1R519_9SOLA|nr:hypothetical protein RND71_035865 [Anisodus tanguticus]
MDFHELLDIPPGDRRRYHDNVSIIIISFEGKIWRSSSTILLLIVDDIVAYAFVDDLMSNNTSKFIHNLEILRSTDN